MSNFDIAMQSAWGPWLNLVLGQPASQDTHIPATGLSEPLTVGFVTTVGEPQGTLAHFGLHVPGNGRIHLRRYYDWASEESYYLGHWDRFDPDSGGLIEHLRYEAPAGWLGICTLLGAILAGPSGALFGGLFGISTLPKTSNETISPYTDNSNLESGTIT